MSRPFARLASALVVALLAVAPALSQVGHPVKGSWSGYLSPNGAERRRILLLLDWENNEIVGMINPGPRGVDLDRAELDLNTWTLTLEAEMPTDRGATERLVTTGKLENLGSWTNRRYSGSYRLGNETGTFLVSLN